MDGRLALYSGAVFAGVLLAGALVIKPGLGDGAGDAVSGDPGSAAAGASSGQGGDSRGFVTRLTSFVRGDDDDEYEDDDDEHERYEHDDDDEDDD